MTPRPPQAEAAAVDAAAWMDVVDKQQLLFSMAPSILDALPFPIGWQVSRSSGRRGG
jgi:hypothetical protein